MSNYPPKLTACTASGDDVCRGVHRSWQIDGGANVVGQQDLPNCVSFNVICKSLAPPGNGMGETCGRVSYA
jgi:hypothetical protein